MKATEFVKKFGWERAKREVALIGTIAVITGDRNWLSDLKRLVESHELVNHMGGLEKAMDAVINQEANGRNMTQLAQAIADVEACQ
ncbi:hypothetical protein HCY66_06885 [Acinetobacter radioresistens]|nr:hypothetical protein [Acinetobacter radioresistens]